MSKKLKHTKTQTELLSFSDLCNGLRLFVMSLVHVAAHANKKLSKGKSQRFGTLENIESGAVASFVQVLLGPIVLDLPRSEGLYIFDLDTCHNKILCELF